MPAEEIEHGRCPGQEHTRIPEEIAAVEKLLGKIERRFLHEALHLEIGAIGCLGFDIAVAAVRTVRHDAEHDECSRFGSFDRAADRTNKGFGIGDRVVGRRKQNERVWIGTRRGQRSDGRRSRGVPAYRLEDDVGRPRGDLLKLLGDEETMGVVRQDRKVAE